MKAKVFVNLIFLPADQPIKKDRLTSLLFWIVSGLGFGGFGAKARHDSELLTALALTWCLSLGLKLGF